MLISSVVQTDGERGNALAETKFHPRREFGSPAPGSTVPQQGGPAGSGGLLRGLREQKYRAVVDLLTQRPGATVQEVADSLRCTHPTASYHLNALFRMGLIVREREGRVVRHYGSQAGAVRDGKIRSLLNEPRTRNLVRFLVQGGDDVKTVNRIATGVGEPFGYVKRLLAALEKYGWVCVERRNFRYSVRVAPAFADLARRSLADERPSNPQGAAGPGLNAT